MNMLEANRVRPLVEGADGITNMPAMAAPFSLAVYPRPRGFQQALTDPISTLVNYM